MQLSLLGSPDSAQLVAQNPNITTLEQMDESKTVLHDGGTLLNPGLVMSGSSSSSLQAVIDDPNKGPVPDAFTPVFEQQAVLTKRPQFLATGPEDGTVLTKRPQSLETSETDPIVQDLF